MLARRRPRLTRRRGRHHHPPTAVVSGGDASRYPFYTFSEPLDVLIRGVTYTFVANGMNPGYQLWVLISRAEALGPAYRLSGSAISGSTGSFTLHVPLDATDENVALINPIGFGEGVDGPRRISTRVRLVTLDATHSDRLYTDGARWAEWTPDE